MKKRIQKIRAASKRSKLTGFGIFVLAFAVIGGLFVISSRAAPGLCSTTNVIGTGTQTVSVPETAQYRLWVRMQVPDTSNTNNLNGVRIELAGGSNQCFTVTTTASNAVNQWQWINSDANAASTAHITASLPAGNYTAKILGLKAGVKVDKVLLLRQDNTCVPSNTVSGSAQPGDNCTTPAPTVTLSANPASVTSGNSTMLSWSSTNATTCTASGGWSGTRSTSGSVSTGNLTTTTSYTLTCTGVGGSGNASTTVTVTPAPQPTVTINANPTTVFTGGSSELTWSTTNATACTASGGWSGSRNTSGTVSTGSLTSTQAFNLSCTGPGGSANGSVTVTVSSTPPPNDTTGPTVTNVASGTTLTAGQNVVIKNQRSIAWQPVAADPSGIKSLVLTVNDQPVSLTNGTYSFGAQANGNGDYVLRAVATDNSDNVTTVTVTIRLRHPDINRNGRVDLGDLTGLMLRWGQASTNHDIGGNVNGTVDLADLTYLMQRWNSTE